MSHYTIAFWNVENLFDVENSPHRPAWLQRHLAQELKGWNETVLTRKISQLAHLIQQLNNGLGPDVLGVCEIENRPVLERLVKALPVAGRDYQIVHADTADERGIDVAFIYDNQIFEKKEQFSQVILKRTATRDLFQVTLQLRHSGRELILIGNHWPSRLGGQFESEPYRMLAGETLAYWHERIIDIKGKDTAILAMGDFNDEPFSRSLVDYALSTYQRQKVMNAQTPRFYNLMWPLLGARLGTHYYDNIAGILDQFLVSRGLLKAGAALSVDQPSVKIEQFPEMAATGSYPAPIRFGRPSEGLNENGFSDHYPISVVLRES